VGKIYVSLPVTVQGDSCSFDVAESECGNQIVLSPTIVRGERNELKSSFVIKSNILVSSYDI
jgi:hypothetical protein